jgi:hypothetical protein
VCVREKIGEIAAGQARGLRSISSDKAVISSLHEAIRARSVPHLDIRTTSHL